MRIRKPGDFLRLDGEVLAVYVVLTAVLFGWPFVMFWRLGIPDVVGCLAMFVYAWIAKGIFKGLVLGHWYADDDD